MKAASGNPGPTKAIAVHPARGAAASSAPGKTWQQAMPEARMRSGMPEPAVMDRTAQRIRFCTSSDGVRVAYATLGSGPPLVKVANWLTHLEFDWTSPVWRHWVAELSRERTLVRYDERGCGLSDWNAADLSFEGCVRDLEAVVDAAGLERFALFGMSQGGAAAIGYAARHPERVTHLALCGAFTRGRAVWARTPGEIEENEMMIRLAEAGWERENPAFRQMFASQFLPDGLRRAASLVHGPDAHNDLRQQCRAAAARVRGHRHPRACAERQVPDAGPARARGRPHTLRRGQARRVVDCRCALRSAGKPQSHPARDGAGLGAAHRRAADVSTGGDRGGGRRFRATLVAASARSSR